MGSGSPPPVGAGLEPEVLNLFRGMKLAWPFPEFQTQLFRLIHLGVEPEYFAVPSIVF